MNCVTDYHRIILALIIIIIGGLAGLINFFTYYFQQREDKREVKIVIKYLLNSIGAAILVPLLLNMLSSNLIKDNNKFDSINYFVFAGFCFIAGYFSDRFINSMGEKILKDLQETKNKANEAIDSAKATEEKVDVLVSTESESDTIEIEKKELKSIQDILPDNLSNSRNLIEKIIKAFDHSKFKFRTSHGIAKVTESNRFVVIKILEELRTLGVTNKIVSKEDNTVLWSLTNLGRELLESSKE
ncbi:YEATS-associated helix-containing protein [Flavobacterium sp.]|uniref:YEATS-associated helix-containing protein n=1 Tax=Flavobacterium sp. TaxID=239 RepID=UPI0031DE5BEB